MSCNLIDPTGTCNKRCNALLPFFSITDLEFKIMNTSISERNSIHSNNNAKFRIKDDEYFSLRKISNIMRKQNNSTLMVHFNTRSLAKNKHLIEEFITEVKYSPEVIGISETKINSNTCLNLNIPGFDFFHNDSSTNAGGVGIYINHNLKHKLRNDLLLNLPNCEDIWTEVSTNQGSIIFTVIYRHPTTNFQAFENALANTLTELENLKLRYVVSGDVNINYLAINNQKISNYFNSLNALGSKLLITAPTRFSRYSKPSLLDHIYSNITKTKIIAKPCLFHISDHLPTCIILNRFSVNKKFKSKMKRCMKFFKLEEFILDLNRQFQNYCDINNQDADVNKDVSRITETFINTLNSHAPLKPMSRREKKIE